MPDEGQCLTECKQNKYASCYFNCLLSKTQPSLSIQQGENFPLKYLPLSQFQNVTAVGKIQPNC